MALNTYAVYRELIQRGFYDDFVDFAVYMRFARGVSLYNSGLIYLQRPGAQMVYTEYQWYKMGRSISPGKTPIVITVPFGPVEFVYDINDTYGKDYKGITKELFGNHTPDSLCDFNILKLINALHSLGISYNSTEGFGVNLFGTAELLEKPISVEYTKRDGKKYKKNTRYAITVDNKLEDYEKVCVILHEAGHILCGHIHYDADPKYIVYTPNRSDDNLDPYVKEYEADEVCRIFCKLLGYEFNPSEHLNQYEKKEIEKSSQFHIMTAVHELMKVW